MVYVYMVYLNYATQFRPGHAMLKALYLRHSVEAASRISRISSQDRTFPQDTSPSINILEVWYPDKIRRCTRPRPDKDK